MTSTNVSAIVADLAERALLVDTVAEVLFRHMTAGPQGALMKAMVFGSSDVTFAEIKQGIEDKFLVPHALEQYYRIADGLIEDLKLMEFLEVHEFIIPIDNDDDDLPNDD